MLSASCAQPQKALPDVLTAPSKTHRLGMKVRSSLQALIRTFLAGPVRRLWAKASAETQIGPATLGDVPYIAGVMAERWNLPQQVAVYDSRNYVERVGGRAAFVARLEGKIIGCGLYDPKNDDVSALYGPWLLLLWVEPLHRRRGVGWRLSRARFEFARQDGVKAIYLDTCGAKQYHLNRGWVEVAAASYHEEPVSILRYDLTVSDDE